LLADSTSYAVIGRATDFPSQDIVTAERLNNLASVCIPRHGKRPKRLPKVWPVSRPLPGAIDVSFIDGHVELVPLERLWQFYWHHGYKPPVRRPGL